MAPGSTDVGITPFRGVFPPNGPTALVSDTPRSRLGVLAFL